jgi:N-acetylneuraminate synthase
VPLILLQCNTNYTASLENFKYIQLRVLRTYAEMYPNLPLGLSDHTPGHSTVLGAVALGACAIEKHFTDDCSRVGPDHAFSMDPISWREMVERTRELEAALGDGIKRVEANESETVVLQRRCARASTDLKAGTVIDSTHVSFLRPATSGSILPWQIDQAYGRTLRKSVNKGEALDFEMFE